jgi:hypothetical protein
MSNKNKPFQPQQKPVVPPVAVVDELPFTPGTLDTKEQADFSAALQVEGKVDEVVGGAPIGEGVQIGGLTVDTPAVELAPVVLVAPATTDALAAIHETLREDLDLPATNVVQDVGVKEDAEMVFPSAVEARLTRIRKFIETMAPGRPVTLDECQQAHGTLHNFFAFELSQDMGEGINREVMEAAAALVRLHKDDVFSDYRVFQNHHVYMSSRIELRDEAAIIIKSFIDLAIYGKRAGKINWEAFSMVVRGAISEKVQTSLRTLFLS